MPGHELEVAGVLLKRPRLARRGPCPAYVYLRFYAVARRVSTTDKQVRGSRTIEREAL
jgi:hypothetical protein